LSDAYTCGKFLRGKFVPYICGRQEIYYKKENNNNNNKLIKIKRKELKRK